MDKDDIKTFKPVVSIIALNLICVGFAIVYGYLAWTQGTFPEIPQDFKWLFGLAFGGDVAAATLNTFNKKKV